MVYQRFRSFDVKRASCFREEERQHLLSVIESGFGDLEVFNSVVRGVFTNMLDASGNATGETSRRISVRRGSDADADADAKTVPRVPAFIFPPPQHHAHGGRLEV
jgi:hypothetical protein